MKQWTRRSANSWCDALDLPDPSGGPFGPGNDVDVTP
jgi:hypothetical protein